MDLRWLLHIHVFCKLCSNGASWHLPIDLYDFLCIFFVLFLRYIGQLMYNMLNN